MSCCLFRSIWLRRYLWFTAHRLRVGSILHVYCSAVTGSILHRKNDILTESTHQSVRCHFGSVPEGFINRLALSFHIIDGDLLKIIPLSGLIEDTFYLIWGNCDKMINRVSYEFCFPHQNNWITQRCHLWGRQHYQEMYWDLTRRLAQPIHYPSIS